MAFEKHGFAGFGHVSKLYIPNASRWVTPCFTHPTLLFAFLGATVGGWIGWLIGEQVGFMMAFMLSIIGTAAGVYFGRKIVK